MEAQFRQTQRRHWVTKLRRNVERDREVDAILAADGWRVVRLWESAIRADPEEAARTVAAQWR